jgi:hypothetical protein
VQTLGEKGAVGLLIALVLASIFNTTFGKGLLGAINQAFQDATTALNKASAYSSKTNEPIQPAGVRS